MSKKRILIATGIYPPDIGGPAEYAFSLSEEWKRQGYVVDVKYFSFEKKMPTGIRHLWFFVKSLISFLRADFVLVLDTWSVALPIALQSFIFRKPFIIRTGGDFLWESYLERTRKKVLFKDFYNTEISSFSRKESFIFRVTKWILSRAQTVVFSTEWQRNIWCKPYNIDLSKTHIIENYFGPQTQSTLSTKKTFIGSTRNIVFKNLDLLKKVFDDTEVKSVAELNRNILPRSEFLNQISSSYAVILVSLGDISPNMIIDAISLCKPFIVTKEIGIYERIKDVAIFVNPLDESDIKEKVLWLCNDDNYQNQLQKIKQFNFIHSWKQVASEFMLLQK